MTTITSSSLVIAAAALLAPAASAQNPIYLFSIDWHGPTVGAIDSTGVAITEGDILMPTTTGNMPALGPLSTPTIAIPHGPGGLGLFPGCAGHLGGTPCVVELDALSLGLDQVFIPGVVVRAGEILFSVDEFATPGLAPFNPAVSTESTVVDGGADAYVNLRPLPGLGFAPFLGFNIAVQDGDGLVSGSGYTYPGVGVVESNAPTPGVPDTGDNVDALDVVQFTPAGGICDVYYSLDSNFADGREGVNNTGSAFFHGFVGGDILQRQCGTILPGLYAPANALGLDLVGGPDSDDLDALILHENGTPGCQVPTQLWQWTSSTLPSDMVVFSVRRGSAVIGMPDSILGIPIEEGDLLVPPVSPGFSIYPGIAIPAESLGLGTVRSGTAAPTGDDLNAADALTGSLFDCDGDGVEDAIAIAFGLVPDTNLDGIPDSCQVTTIGTPFCLCTTAAPAPCGNVFPTGGCLNASATGAVLSGSGSTSWSADNLVLTTSGMNPTTFALTIRSLNPNAPVPIQNGLLCLQNTIYRFPPYPTGTGTASYGPGIVLSSQTFAPPAGWIFSGQTWNFQTWYRDIGGPCGGFANFSNALAVTFTP